jgi:hypothetical protein
LEFFAASEDWKEVMIDRLSGLSLFGAGATGANAFVSVSGGNVAVFPIWVPHARKVKLV